MLHHTNTEEQVLRRRVAGVTFIGHSASNTSIPTHEDVSIEKVYFSGELNIAKQKSYNGVL